MFRKNTPRPIYVTFVTMAIVAGILVILFASQLLTDSDERSAEEVLEKLVEYVMANHPDSKQLLGSVRWVGVKVDVIPSGKEFVYRSGGWTIMLRHETASGLYDVRMEYSNPGVGIPERILWEGSYIRGAITERNYFHVY